MEVGRTEQGFIFCCVRNGRDMVGWEKFCKYVSFGPIFGDKLVIQISSVVCMK